jgi:hypothetical protein
LGIRLFVEKHVDGGVDAVRQELGDPALREFFSQMFVAAGWYDILPIIEISKVIGTVMGLGQAEYVRRSATWHAELDMKGVYKAFQKWPSPEAVCLRFTSMHAQFYDFGKVEILEVGKNQVRAQLSGMPRILTPWWQTAAEWYIYVILKAAGAKNGRLMFQPLQPNGVHAGVELVTAPSITVWE